MACCIFLLHLIDTEATFSSSILRGFLRMITSRPNINTQYNEEALKHVFGEIKERLKKAPPHKRSEEALRNISSALKRQKKPYSWDYREYFNELFD